MHNELLDIVDLNNQVIGARSRFDIHRLGLRHRAVHILVRNQNNQFFLQKRSMSKDINPGLWDTAAAGHVDRGEDYDRCAARELTEELGISADDTLALLFKMDASAATGMEFVQVYLINHDGPFDLCADEIDEGQWFEPSKITSRVTNNDPELTETFKQLWRQFIAE